MLLSHLRNDIRYESRTSGLAVYRTGENSFCDGKTMSLNAPLLK